MYAWSDEELLVEVNTAHTKLAETNKRVIHRQIADEIGVTLNTLNGRPKVRERLAEITALYT